MDLRIMIEPQQGASYADQLRIAKATEDLGFDGFFRSDHFLAMGQEGLPGPTDSFVTLGALARETSRIRLGTMVASATFRLPGVLAISVAQIDEMSGGRIELGLGTGWFEREHAAYGIAFPSVRERFDRFEEQIEIVHGLWTTPAGKTFDYDGAHYQLSDSPALPKPVQSPHPPIIFGGGGKRRSAALAARYGDEYNVSFNRAQTAAVYGRVREAAAETGRTLKYSAAQTVCIGRDEAEFRRRADAIGQDVADLRENSIAGTPAEALERIGEFADWGSDRLYLQVLDLSDVDHLELIAAEILPHV
jgi:F420-dependent oxidoreductase-like protein